MRIGIIAEGGADIAVITNIIKGITGLDSNNIVPLRPQMSFDNTHLSHLNPDSFSNWKLVMEECKQRKKIDDFFLLDDSTHIVIHLDTAESHLYEIEVPVKNYHQYCKDIRQTMINKINELLENNYLDKTLYAIAVEETDAWLLAINGVEDSCKTENSKRKLEYILGKTVAKSTYANFLLVSKGLSSEAEIFKNKWLEKNCSLKLFYEEVQNKLVDQ